MTRVGVITQARMTSTRLPGKVLLPAGGRTMLDHHLARLAPLGVPVIVATTRNATDDPIAEVAQARGLACFRGSEGDVLSRFAGAAAAERLDVVVRVTSDCPLIDSALIARGIDRFLELDDPRAYVSNTLERSYPRGFDFEVFSAAALRDADLHAVAPAEREHVTPSLYLGRTGPRHAVVRAAGDASHYRVTLDTSEDLLLLRTLIEDHGASERDAEGVIAVLDAHPELAALNAHVEQKKLGE